MTLSTSTSHLVVGSSGNPNPRLVGQVDPMAVNHLIAWPPSFASTITLNIRNSFHLACLNFYGVPANLRTCAYLDFSTACISGG